MLISKRRFDGFYAALAHLDERGRPVPKRRGDRQAERGDSPEERRSGAPDHDLIPGAGVVGFGFDITRQYNQNSVTSQLFSTVAGPETTQTIDGTTYSVPFNMSYQPISSTSAQSYVTESQLDFARTFAQNIGVDASIGAFSGEFDHAYSDTFNSSQSFYYCWYDGSQSNYRLIINEQGLPYVNPTFAADVAALPTEYNDATAQNFYDLFIKYGTHYVASVTLGASFRYYVSVQTSYSSDQQSVKDSVELEYKAVFVDDKVHAEQDWSTLTTNWASSRNVMIVTQGGDNSMAGVAAPGYGANASDLFKAWLASAQKMPAVTDFSLRPISLICDSGRFQAVDKALTDYLNAYIFLRADLAEPPGGPTTSFEISVFNQTIDPPAVPPMPAPSRNSKKGKLVPVGGFQLVLLDRRTYLPLLNTVYYMPALDSDPDWQVHVQDLYAQMLSDVKSVASNDYIVALNGFGIESMLSFPPKEVANWLYNCGAKLDAWRQHIASSAPDYVLNYLFIGGPGAFGRPVERCHFVDWQAGNDTSKAHSLLTSAQMAVYGI